MTAARSVVNIKDGACQSYYNGNPLVDYTTGGLLFRLPGKIVDALAHYVLYKFSFRMGDDPILTALAVQCCSEIA